MPQMSPGGPIEIPNAPSRSAPDALEVPAPDLNAARDDDVGLVGVEGVEVRRELEGGFVADADVEDGDCDESAEKTTRRRQRRGERKNEK